MRKYFLIVAIFICSVGANAQVLGVPLVTQEQNEWCWAGCTKCILSYYGIVLNQCTIAEYTRSVSTCPYTYGATNCCTSATAGCNTPNYNWGCNGSIQDILVHFGTIMNTGVSAALTTTEIATEMAGHRPFVQHWSWVGGGGHFVVGQGISGTGASANIYYMNPWPAEGLSFGTYTWMLNGTNDMGTHTWDMTNKITSFPTTAIPQVAQTIATETVYPNPSTGSVWVKGSVNSELNIFSITGSLVYSCTLATNNDQVELGNLAKGMYIVKINSAEGSKVSKLVLQ